MHLRITEEPSRGGREGETTIFYLREVPFVPGRSIQASALHLEGARWLASRISGVDRLDLPPEKRLTQAS